MNHITNSHILVHEFDYLEPASLKDALALLTEHGDRAQVMAGGTNLLVWIKMEQRAPECVINIGKLPGLAEILSQDRRLQIGALTTIRALRNAPQVQADYTALAEACASFGSTQIQMMGTIGGNLCNGSPASDTVPALVAFGAQLALVGSGEEKIRFLSVEEFLLAPGKTALRSDELLVSIMLLSPHRGGVGSAFIKISRVEADLAKASVAAVVAREDDRVVDCRLAYGSVGPTVMRARKAEELLIGETFNAELALEAGQVASEEITPIDDARSTAWYRREVVKAITHDALQTAWQRAGEQGSRGAEEQGSGGDRETKWQGETRNTFDISRFTQHEIELTINGEQHRFRVKPNELLLNLLRERLELTGTKYGCGIGECGACTVLLNGEPVLACLVLAIAVDGSEVLTVEGLQGPNGELDPLQESFIEQNAFQCGYCTPGMLMMAQNLLQENPSPTEDEIREHLKGNRCRCTGYAAIVRAVTSCAQVS